MKNKRLPLFLLIFVFSVTGCKGFLSLHSSESESEEDVEDIVEPSYVHDTDYPFLNGLETKDNYNSAILTSKENLSIDYLSHSWNDYPFNIFVSNTIDGLVSYNEFGALELNLAESAVHQVINGESHFTFKLKDDPNMIWVTCDGTPYKVENKRQKVNASDFATGLIKVLERAVDDEPSRIAINTIKRALEYYLYSRIIIGINKGEKAFTVLNTD